MSYNKCIKCNTDIIPSDYEDHIRAHTRGYHYSCAKEIDAENVMKDYRVIVSKGNNPAQNFFIKPEDRTSLINLSWIKAMVFLDTSEFHSISMGENELTTIFKQ